MLLLTDIVTHLKFTPTPPWINLDKFLFLPLKITLWVDQSLGVEKEWTFVESEIH